MSALGNALGGYSDIFESRKSRIPIIPLNRKYIPDIEDFIISKKIGLQEMKDSLPVFDAKNNLHKQIFDVVTPLLHLVQKNAVTVSRTEVSTDASIDIDERKRMALVLYPRVSFLNHSCKPNCILAFGDQGKVQVKVTETVEAGNRLNITYNMLEKIRVEVKFIQSIIFMLT